MSYDGWSTALVLGGIRSGKSAFAESLVTGAAVRYLATSREDADDAEWAARIAAHRARRPGTWTTEELGDAPARLAALISEAKSDEVLLVDDLGGWVASQLPGGDTAAAALTELAVAVRETAGRVVIVSSEAGLSLVARTALGRAFVDGLGATNQALAEACDAVALVVAGQPTWLKRAIVRRSRPVDAGAAPPLTDDAGLQIRPGLSLPLPDEEAANEAEVRLRGLDVPGLGLGGLAGVVRFAAGTQQSARPRPWRSVRVLLVHGDHDGACAAGESASDAARRAREAAAGEGALGVLVAEVGAGLRVVGAPAARPIETEDALTADEVDEALRYGWQLAEDAVDSGVDAIVVGACGAGSGTAAAAVTAAVTGAETVTLLGRVEAPGGRYDDGAWMARCAAVRDALHRTRDRPRGAHDLLASLGGGDLAIVTGILLGAAARRTPILLDGPVGVVAGLVSRDIAGQARHWCLLPDDGGHPTVRYAADVLDLKPVLDLRLGLGEGAGALAALPLLRAGLTLAAMLPEHPGLAAPATPEGPVIDVGLSTPKNGDQTGVDRPTSTFTETETDTSTDDPDARA